MSSNELFFATLARLLGLFLVAPFFSSRFLPFTFRLGLAVLIALAWAPLNIETLSFNLAPLLLVCLKEIIIGYLIGLIAFFVLEAAHLGGQLFGTLAGFSATELLDPQAGSTPLFSKVFVLFIFTLFIALDLHHTLVRLIYESLRLIPPGEKTLSSLPLLSIVERGSLFFKEALALIALPLSCLTLLILSFALLSRLFPYMQVFWIAFPLQMLLGFGALILSSRTFSHFLQNSFYSLLTFIKKGFFSL